MTWRGREGLNGTDLALLSRQLQPSLRFSAMTDATTVTVEGGLTLSYTA